MTWTGDQMVRHVGDIIAGPDGSVARILLEALAVGQSPVDSLIRPAAGADPAELLDPPTAPRWLLPLVAAMSGVTLTTDDYARDASAARDRIIRRAVKRRGTPDAIVAEVQAVLTGSRTVELTERADGDPDLIRIRTYAAESPAPEVVRAAAMRAKEAGIVLDVQIIPGQTWADLLATGATWGSLRDSGATWDDVRTTIPP